MNRAVNKNHISVKVITFWSILIILTMFFIGFIVYRFVENSKVVDRLDNLTNLSGQQVFQQGETYYVFVYSKQGVTEGKAELDKLNDLEEVILNYLTFQKRNPTEMKMYGMIVDSYENYSILIEGSTADTNVVGKGNISELRINKEDVPILLKIQNARVAAAYITQNSIREELQKTINS